MLGYKSNSYSSSTKRQEKKTGAQTASEGADRLGKFGSAVKDTSKGNDIVSRIQKYGQAENARKKKPAETKSTAPQKGFFGKMMDKYVYGKKDK